MTHELSHARHILVINLKYLGDSIWMLPFVDNLKQNVPAATVSVLVNEGTEVFFRGRPSVDHVFPFPRQRVKAGPGGLVELLSFVRGIRKLKPDVAIDLSDTDRPAVFSLLSGAGLRVGYDNAREWRRHLYNRVIQSKINSKHMVEYHLDVLREMGLVIYDDSIRIPVAPAVFEALRDKWPTAFHRQEDKKKVLIHPGARNRLRQWGPEKYAALCDALAADCRIFLVAGPGEGDILRELVGFMRTEPEIVAPKVDLCELAALCELSDLFIGNDSGPIHVAAAKTFTVGIYGPTLPQLISPWTKRKLLIEGPALPCRPCRQEVCENQEYNACIMAITTDEVIGKVRKILPMLQP
ncbi:MAG: glycosyltransferase family 9 protein [Smithellaceae bacterium]|nr:glycosyltransferase family 9 protein [Smithellaceae bacterium]